MHTELSFNEIRDHKQFEDFIAAYFENLPTIIPTIPNIQVQASGVGADGGRDILVHMKMDDIDTKRFKRSWVIQCKFHDSDISTNKIADINIPTLIYSYKAQGYLLVCKQKPTSKLTQLFERLEKSCIFGYRYEIWSGERIKYHIISNLKNNRAIIQQFFPKYFDYCIKNNYF